MQMAILSSFLSSFIQTVMYIFACKYFLDSLAIEMHELKSRRDDVKREIHNSKRQGKEPTNHVRWWLYRVEALESKFIETNEQFQNRFMFPKGFSPNIWSSYQISKTANAMTMEAHYLIGKGFFHEIMGEAIANRFEEMPSVPTIGIDLVFEQLQQLIADDGIGIIGIFGLAGVGKTALLSRFHNEFLEMMPDLDIIIFIHTSKVLNIQTMQKEILDRLSLSWKDYKTEKVRAAAIYKVLSKMKFVIILDDIWIPLDFQTIGIPIPKQSSKCKIILATRNENVCDQMDAKKKIKLECLQWESAWRLFTEKVGKQLVISHPEIQRQAEILVRKCDGLPLALITMARALASRRSPEEWKQAIALMDNDPSQLPGIEENLLSPLKASYDNLPSDKLRLCASHFCLHWDGCRIHKNLLQDHWIGEGIIDDFEDMEEANNKVCYIIGTLSAASLVERIDAEGYTKMHPIIRTMVLWAEQSRKQEKKWVVKEREGLVEPPDIESWQSSYRLALGYNKIATLPEAPKCPNLFSLKLKNNMNIQKIPESFFRFMPCLVILDLHSTPIRELPAAIGNLVMLQFLELYRTKIRYLPQELDALVKLKYLGLNWTTDLIDIPNGVIEKFVELQVLQMTASYGSWNVGGDWEGVDFEELESLRRIRILDITIGSLAALRRLSESYRLAASTVVLLIKGCQGLRTIKLSSTTHWRHMKSLKWLRLSHSNDLEEVIIDRKANEEEEEVVLPKLEHVVLEQLQKAKFIWISSCVENLQGLYIYRCNGMEQLVYCEDGEDAKKEAWRGSAAPFPNLKELALHGLAGLRRIIGEGRTLIFPSLKTIEILDCPKLKQLNITAEELREIKCQRSWWDKLEWQDEKTKSSFQQHIISHIK